MKHPILIILLCVVTLIANARASMGGQTKGSSQTASNSNPQAEKIKSQVRKVGTGGKITVKLLNSREYHGTIKWIDEDNFQLDEVDLKQVVVVNYAETKKVYAGYGGRGFSGQRVHPHYLLVGIAGLVGILAIGILVATQTK